MNQMMNSIKKVTKAPLTVTYVEKPDLKHFEDMESSKFIHEHLSIEVENGQFLLPVWMLKHEISM
ncbi:hypothetical protein K7432_017376 [Basidiobolus ranarum]|uniref:GINS subunit domain-containing protein n=1 Tax=Basidiobolus ranarum TaxID=34480 RepID=A0ABR2VLJ3_9FUNG